MGLARQLLHRAAICKTTMISENEFKIEDDIIETTNIEKGEMMKVRVSRGDLGDDIQPNDSFFFRTPLLPNNQVFIPGSGVEQLDLEPGDIITYIAVAEKSFPGFTDGPLRDRIGDVTGRNDTANATQEIELPEPTTDEVQFTGGMFVSGQVTMPEEERNALGVAQGSEIFGEIENQGQTATFVTSIDKSGRVYVPKKARDKVGVDADEKPEVTITASRVDEN